MYLCFRIVFLTAGYNTKMLVFSGLSGLRQFWSTESPLRKMKDVYFTLKALFILKILEFLSWLFGHVEK